MAGILNRIFARHGGGDETKRLEGPAGLTPYAALKTAFSSAFYPTHNTEHVFESNHFKNSIDEKDQEYLQAAKHADGWVITQIQKYRDIDGKQSVLTKIVHDKLEFYEALYRVAAYDILQRNLLGEHAVIFSHFGMSRLYRNYAHQEEIVFDRQGLPHLTHRGNPVTGGNFEQIELDNIRRLYEERLKKRQPLKDLLLEEISKKFTLPRTDEDFSMGPEEQDRIFKLIKFERSLNKVYADLRMGMAAFYVSDRHRRGPRDWNDMGVYGTTVINNKTVDILRTSYPPEMVLRNNHDLTDYRSYNLADTVYHEFARRISAAEDKIEKILTDPLCHDDLAGYLRQFKLQICVFDACWHFQQFRQVRFPYNEEDIPLRRFTVEASERLEAEMSAQNLPAGERDELRRFAMHMANFDNIYGQMEKLIETYSKNMDFVHAYINQMIKEVTSGRDKPQPGLFDSANQKRVRTLDPYPQ